MKCLVCTGDTVEIRPHEASDLKGEGVLCGCGACDFLYLRAPGAPLTVDLMKRPLSAYMRGEKRDHSAMNRFGALHCPLCRALLSERENRILRVVYSESILLLCEPCDVFYVQSSRKWLSIRAVPHSAANIIKIDEDLGPAIEKRAKEEREVHERDTEMRDPDAAQCAGSPLYSTEETHCGMCGHPFEYGERILVIHTGEIFCDEKKECRPPGAAEARRYSPKH